MLHGIDVDAIESRRRGVSVAAAADDHENRQQEFDDAFVSRLHGLPVAVIHGFKGQWVKVEMLRRSEVGGGFGGNEVTA